jgi:TrmH family RNA methyltransferase
VILSKISFRQDQSAMAIVRLTSKDNPLIKTIRHVASQARNAPPGLILVEGLRSLEEAAAAGCAMEAVVMSDSFGTVFREKQLLEDWTSAGASLYRAADSLLSSLSDVRTPQGAIALVHVPELRLRDVPLSRDPLLLCACAVQDPGNLGTLIRAAAAAGAAMVCTIPGTVSARNPKAVRASAGTCFRVPVIEHLAAREFLSFCREHEIGMWRTDPHAGIPYFEANLRSPTAILLGNEAQGISQPGWETLPSIHIPMAPGVESLNVGAAGAILLFEAYRQRSTGSKPGQSTPKA